MDELEIRVLLLNKELGTPALLERDWGRSPPALHRYRWQSQIELGPYMLGEEPLGLKHYYLALRDGTPLPVSGPRAGEARGGAASAGHGGMDLYQKRFDEYSRGEGGVNWI